MNKRIFSAVAMTLVSLALVTSAFTQTSGVDEARVRAHMEFLASDEMQGRGSGTKYEKLAGLYLASQMKQMGIAPGGDKDAKGLAAYLQTVTIERIKLGTTSLQAGETTVNLIPLRVNGTEFSGTLDRTVIGEETSKGTIALVKTVDGSVPRSAFGAIFSSAANAVVVVAPPALIKQTAGFARRGASITKAGGGEGGFTSVNASVYLITEEEAAKLKDAKEGSELKISSAVASTAKSYTWNSVGKIEGSSKNGESILLSAHMDHIGVRENAPGDDKIFNGADDDASGCVAVLELARILSQEPKPKRTILFAFFGSEEAGGFGSKYFVDNLGFPLDKLAANLQFEMLGRPDEAVGKDELWLTGFERSDLGSELAKNGAKLVADPHPTENFFERSDNITLARKGVVAHTVSSFGLHKDYHQASDEIGTINFGYMTRSIDSMVVPVKWLVNTDWRPSWKEGMKP
jgi:Zn-dependent M28 family amino/carboxypeptidase